MNGFPFTNFHDINLDWILAKLRKAVFTVNGQGPDDNGNINLAGVAGVTSVNSVGPDSTGNVTLTPADINALPDSYTAPVQSVQGKTGNVILSASDVNAMPIGYTAPVASVNGQTGAVVLDAADVGALPDSTVIPDRTSQLINDSGFLTAQQAGAVTSVNGKVGAVVLDATDVSALPSSTVVPTLTSQLVNDSGFITQAQAAPVSSVNGEVGAVVLDAADVGATPAGQGIPSGGTIGQVLGKTGSSDYVTGWVNPPSGSTWETETLKTNLIIYRNGNARILVASGVGVTNPLYTLNASDYPDIWTTLSQFGLQGTTASNRAACFLRVNNTGSVWFSTFSGSPLASGDGWGMMFWTVAT